jgi:hypothetical protein
LVVLRLNVWDYVGDVVRAELILKRGWATDCNQQLSYP